MTGWPFSSYLTWIGYGLEAAAFQAVTSPSAAKYSVLVADCDTSNGVSAVEVIVKLPACTDDVDASIRCCKDPLTGVLPHRLGGLPQWVPRESRIRRAASNSSRLH